MILLVIGLFVLIGRLFSPEPMIVTAIVALAVIAALSALVSKFIFRLR
jgi:hypothetical protein